MRSMQCNVGFVYSSRIGVLCVTSRLQLGVDRETQLGGTSPGTCKPDVCPELMGRRHKGSRYTQDLGPFIIYLHN